MMVFTKLSSRFSIDCALRGYAPWLWLEVCQHASLLSACARFARAHCFSLKMADVSLLVCEASPQLLTLVCLSARMSVNLLRSLRVLCRVQGVQPLVLIPFIIVKLMFVNVRNPVTENDF